MEKKIEFIRCPRCELNYINKNDGVCSVCKKEMEGAYSKGDDSEIDDLSAMEICPICKTNYIREDEDCCASCKSEQELDNDRDIDIDSDWNESDDDDMIEMDSDDELGEMVNTIDIEEDDLSNLDDLDLSLPPMNDVEFSDDMPKISHKCK